MSAKPELRKRLKEARRAHVLALATRTRALLFVRPPRAITDTVPVGAVIGVYAQKPEEAPASGYARWFFEAVHPIALPWFADRDAPMEFRAWANPHDPDSLEPGPFGILQPAADAAPLVPDVAFVPLVGFTASGARLGMGAGHYDRWLAAHPETRAIGLAWDCQEAPLLPLESHDRMLEAVITPTRLFGPFAGAAGQ